MKLVNVHIKNFRSIIDSNQFEISDITCLVGKNEAGKTALLKALYKLNPVASSDGSFDLIEEYPRQLLNDYQDAVDNDEEVDDIVTKAVFELEESDISLVEEKFGPSCLKSKKPTITLKKGYENTTYYTAPEVNQDEAVAFLVSNANLSITLTEQLNHQKDLKLMIEILSGSEQTESVQKLNLLLQKISKSGLQEVIYRDFLDKRIPEFLYFDEYYQMKGQDNLDQLFQRVQSKKLEKHDHPLLGLIEIARLELNQLLSPKKTESLLSKLEAAESQLTSKILGYWSQNRHLRLKFDIRPGQQDDPPEMRGGTNILGRVQDTKHNVSTPLGSRSRGFVWFFSFLAWYSKLKKEKKNLILLLDEPGLSLHAKAQEDLLRYFEVELMPNHQVIYSTHSPFMVDSKHFDRVRIVQDLSIERESDDLPSEKQGTKVFSEILEATEDTLFPLQGALGYEIYQSLFIGPNSLVVEGVSDLIYLQAITSFLNKLGKDGLSHNWTITPVGGSDKVPTFVALLGSQKNLNVTVLIDLQKKDQQTIENLYKKKLLSKKKVLTYNQFTLKQEADIEDLFEVDFYLRIVNGEYGTTISESDLSSSNPRVTVRLEEYFSKNPLPGNNRFNHYRPARYFAENITALQKFITDTQIERFTNLCTALNSLL
jgi:predicted ATP-dependent endonuclease of OLD family